MSTFRANVSGRVQGVGFRYFAQRKAEEYGLWGYTKNLPDGNVEVVAEGEKEKLTSFSEELKKGPALARVDDVRIVWSDADQHFKEFSIRY